MGSLQIYIYYGFNSGSRATATAAPRAAFTAASITASRAPPSSTNALTTTFRPCKQYKPRYPHFDSYTSTSWLDLSANSYTSPSYATASPTRSYNPSHTSSLDRPPSLHRSPT